MTTSTIYTKGKCGVICLRLKQWKSGFSIKCDKKRKTLVGMPFHKELYIDDFRTFCIDCEQATK